jgi:Fe-S-cluster containining protein
MVERAGLRSLIIEYTCAEKCMGHPKNRGGCCTLADRDFIIGPVTDAPELLERLAERSGRPVLHTEVLIDYEEGRALFPMRKNWQNPAHYPALRVVQEPGWPCRFYDGEAGRCTIYEIRPGLCRRYECDWLKQRLESVL